MSVRSVDSLRDVLWYALRFTLASQETAALPLGCAGFAGFAFFEISLCGDVW
jgi:hypothetical protein